MNSFRDSVRDSVRDSFPREWRCRRGDIKRKRIERQDTKNSRNEVKSRKKHRSRKRHTFPFPV